MSLHRRRLKRLASKVAPAMAPLTPALAVIAFAAANAAAQVGAGNALSDVQVGERGKILRVALICEDDCRVGARASGEYFIPGLKETLDIDLKGRSRNASALAFAPVDGGTALSVRTGRIIVASAIKRCAIGGAKASCIDLEFADAAPKVAKAPAPAGAGGRGPVAEAAAPAAPAAPVATAGPHILATLQPVSAPPPRLREAPKAEQLAFARFAPPERFDPPASPAPVEAQAPTLDRAHAAKLLGADFDLRATAENILKRGFGAAECASAKARLKADAWALDAMVDIGFCDAADGRLAEADDVFARLLAYTPDNYAALVGRALVAAKGGDRSSAGRYFQEALNALPPIAESDRIVKAMAQL